jgi:hypothetical protein
MRCLQKLCYPDLGEIWNGAFFVLTEHFSSRKKSAGVPPDLDLERRRREKASSGALSLVRFKLLNRHCSSL